MQRSPYIIILNITFIKNKTWFVKCPSRLNFIKTVMAWLVEVKGMVKSVSA
jgi:hypothetical protein